MPVYRQRKDWFFAAMDSLCQQTYEDKEIIVSGIILDSALEWAKSFEGVKVVDSRIPDPKRQINEGIKFASGDVILQAGSDDILMKNALADMMKVYEDKDAVLVYGDMEYCDPEMNMIYINRFPPFDMANLRERQMIPDVSLVRKTVLWEFGLFDIELFKFAVWDMWLKIGEKYALGIHHCGRVIWKYRRHDNSLGQRCVGEEHREMFFKKWNIPYKLIRTPLGVKVA
jgi:glycosyltransferase involved in cell wall biosynthesis